MKRSWVVVGLLLARVAHAEPDPLVDLAVGIPNENTAQMPPFPAVPSFALPSPNADGTHSPRELRLGGRRYLGTEVTVRGVVTWAYDCVADIRVAGQSVKEVQKRIDEDSSLCERAKLFLGDASTTSPELGVWVVDLPRPYNKLELKRIKRPDRDYPDRCEPDEKDPAKQICGPYRVGDELEVTGTWALESPHAERNSAGLLIYKRMKNLTQRWESPGPKPVLASPPPPPPPAAWVETRIARPAWKRIQVKRSQLRATEVLISEAERALRDQRYDDAIASLTSAIGVIKQHHLAWYFLAEAHLAKGDWTAAEQAASTAVAIQPVVAIYQQSLGRARYRVALQQAREELARKTNRSPDTVIPDYRAIDFSAALLPLRTAVMLEPKLWRAQFLIGSIHDYAQRPALAAQAWTRACATGTWEALPWLALGELYRQWGHLDQAIAVLDFAAHFLLPGAEAYAALGAVFEDKRQFDKAIAAYTGVFSTRRDYPPALFGRGRAYLAQGDHAKAKADLEAFSKVAPTSDSVNRIQASRMLSEIAAKLARP